MLNNSKLPSLRDVKKVRKGLLIVDPNGNTWEVEGIVGEILFVSHTKPDGGKAILHDHRMSFIGANWITLAEAEAQAREFDLNSSVNQLIEKFGADEVVKILSRTKGGE